MIYLPNYSSWCKFSKIILLLESGKFLFTRRALFALCCVLLRGLFIIHFVVFFALRGSIVDGPRLII